MTRPGTLLVVDDNEANRDALSRRLRLRGYTVHVAVSGSEALTLAEMLPLDLVLLDVEMPGIGGFDVLRRLRERSSDTVLPVIMVTARSEGDDIVEAFRLGANDYVTKPVDFPVALARIEMQLSRKWAIESLRESEERYALAVSGANDGLWDWNLSTNVVYWSPRWKSMLGHEEHEISADPGEWFSRIHPEDVERVTASLEAHIAGGAGHFESEHRLRHHNETFRWVLCRGAAVRNAAGAATRLAGSLTDITSAKLADPLTGLPNRLLFLDLVARAIKRAERRPQYMFALLVVGLDRFSVVHDSLGPLAADRLLVDVARRLQNGLRSTDVVTRERPEFTLARADGDEFNVLLDDIGEARDAIRVAERLRLALEEPFDVNGTQVFITATTGIAASTTGYHEAEAVLRDATTALNRARASNSTAYEIFDPEMRARAVSRLQAETDLRQAIEQRAFELHYQPILAIATGRIAGFEALLRWRHPQRGLLLPAEFMHIAEDTGMILDIGRFSLAESCRQMAEWRGRFGGAAPAVMCVNVSSRQLADEGIIDDFIAVLQRSGLPPSSLKVEITETALIGDVPSARLTVTRMQAMGVAWSLDDFGTGYSSLSYLHQLQVDTVKVDRSFVARLGALGAKPELVQAIIALAHNLGMDVVAEGVETEAQLEALRGLGCDQAQGFFFSPAVDADAAGRMIVAQPWAAASHSRT